MTESNPYKGGPASERERLIEQARDALQRADILTMEARDARKAGNEKAAEILADRSQYWRNKAREIRRKLEQS